MDDQRGTGFDFQRQRAFSVSFYTGTGATQFHMHCVLGTVFFVLLSLVLKGREW